MSSDDAEWKILSLEQAVCGVCAKGSPQVNFSDIWKLSWSEPFVKAHSEMVDYGTSLICHFQLNIHRSPWLYDLVQFSFEFLKIIQSWDHCRCTCSFKNPYESPCNFYQVFPNSNSCKIRVQYHTSDTDSMQKGRGAPGRRRRMLLLAPTWSPLTPWRAFRSFLMDCVVPASPTAPWCWIWGVLL